MPFIAAGSGQVHYSLFSFGEDGAPLKRDVIFILPGMAFSEVVFQPLAKILAKSYSVITVNHREVGPSTAKTSELPTIREMIQDTRTIMAKHDIDDAHFVGESFGGMLAMGMGVFAGDRVKSLIIVNSSIAGQRL